MDAETNEATTARGELSRRRFLNASAGGAAGLVGWSLLGGRAAAATSDPAAPGGAGGPASLVLSLNPDWLFGGPWVPGSSEPGFDDSGFNRVGLPHCVTPLSWREWDPASWTKVWTYRRHFPLPPQAQKMRAFVDFAGALTSITPTINGHTLARHQGGYLPAAYELTDHLVAEDNVLAVTLDSTWQSVPPEGNPKGPESIDLFEAGGLYRDVALRFVPQIFVSDVFAKPVDVLTGSPRVDVECTVDSAVTPSSPLKVVVELLDRGRPLARTSVPVPLSRPGQATVSVTLRGLESVRLWDNENPNLYQVVARVYMGSHPLHDFSRRIGFRQAEFTPDGFFLNGKRLKIFGLNRHQIYPYTAMAMPARVQRHDAELLKKLNCNMVRMSHYPQDPAFLDACDELGIMLWEETPGWQYIGDSAWQDQMLRDVQAMVVRDRSRPSVVIWGVKANEASHQYVSLYTQAKDLADSLDGSRPTSGTSYKTTEDFVFDVMARDAYNGRQGNAYLDPQNGVRGVNVPPYPGVPYLVTESVGALSGAPYYRWIDDQATLAMQARMHAQVHNIAGAEDAICGVLAWCFADYDSPHGNIYQNIKWPGVVDTFRVPKPGAAPYLAQVDPSVRTVIEPAFFWDFGPTSPVTTLGANAMIWSNCDRLEAYLDGVHHATLTPNAAPTDAGAHQGYAHLAHAPFYLDTTGIDAAAPPELRLDGYVGSRRVLSRSFSADHFGDRLALDVDDTSLVADGCDATRVAFRAVDRHGNPRPYATGDVTVSVTGPAVWLGQVLTFAPLADADVVPLGGRIKVTATLANGRFPFESNGGVGGIWLRSLLDQPGSITVTVTHPTLGTATARIHSDQPPVSAFSDASRPRPHTDPVAAMTFTDVVLSLEASSVWDVQPAGPTSFSTLPPGSTATSTWTVTAPPRTTTPPGGLTAKSAFTLAGNAVTTTAPIPVMLVATLVQAFNNVGTSPDSDPASGDFSGSHTSYSSDALAAAGLTPGATVKAAGLTFTWPDTALGRPDNVIAEGQIILVEPSPGATTLGFLGASANGGTSGPVVITYTDGTSTTRTISFDAWQRGPSSGTTVAASIPYRNGKSGVLEGSTYVYAITVPIDPSRTVRTLTLPNATNGKTTMHIFAVALGS
ncbi:glycoside hydrolase family 2 TIM barrel-domain containing protein [Streptomyces sp. NPDC058424]|uniref:glycoside hydrolase family 2 protein n=1 Tax=Streptomyces sp. NPDC058424 TaxID=3346491 RepID=UPI003650AD48